VDGSSTGIAMHHITVVIPELRMSAFGTKLPFAQLRNSDRFAAQSSRVCET